MNRQEAINIVKKNWPDSSFTSLKEALEFLIPELMNTDDEKIKEAIIKGITHAAEEGCFCADNYSVKECIAWLEKQGEQKSIDDLTQQEAMNIAVAKCFEQGEQKPTDKDEPMFHEGEWISGYYTNYKILSVNSEGYVVEDVDGNKINILFENEKFHHLWTIQDAKDGDVLVYPDGTFTIFKKIVEEGLYLSYVVQEQHLLRFNSTCAALNCYPATKAQRDTLMKVIADADYEWDAEKKELKKIKNQKPLLSDFFKAEYERGKADAQTLAEWSEEDKKMSRFIGNAVTTDGASEYLESKGIQVIDAHVWLDELKERIKPQPQQEWDEEDCNQIGTIACHLDNIGNEAMAELLLNIMNKYKSLKPQNTWKPSGGQIKACKEVYADILSAKGFDLGTINSELNRLEEQLKKLK